MADRPTSPEIHPALAARWSPRAFSPRPVEPAVLDRLFEAARWAASSRNEQPWAFVVATADDPAAHARLLGGLVPFNREWAAAAPVLVAVLARETFAATGQPNAHAWHDVGLAVAGLMFQATADGLAVHAMAGILPAELRRTYAIPDGWSPVEVLAVGHVGDPATLPEPLRERELAPRTRRPRDQFVFRDDGRPLNFLPPPTTPG